MLRRIGFILERETTWATDSVDLRCRIRPLLGSCGALQLTTHDIARWQEDVVEGKTARVAKLGFRRKSHVKGGRNVVGRATAGSS